MNRERLFVWWGMGYTCTDLRREVEALCVGNVEEFKACPDLAGSPCEPTPWR
jgi:hypothetical protein